MTNTAEKDTRKGAEKVIRKKGPFVDPKLLKAVRALISKAESSRMTIKTWSRRSTILPFFVGLTFNVHNGRKHIPVLVSEHMVGKKLGEFSPTRTFHGHGANRKAVRS